jgi:hypothetical protein
MPRIPLKWVGVRVLMGIVAVLGILVIAHALFPPAATRNAMGCIIILAIIAHGVFLAVALRPR